METYYINLAVLLVLIMVFCELSWLRLKDIKELLKDIKELLKNKDKKQ